MDNEVMAYNPMAILNLFNNAISVSETKKIIRAKGIYLHGKGANYSGYYYDTLRDESSDASMTLIVPALIRNLLAHNKTIIFYGYITKRVVNTGGRIELQLTITELVEQIINKYSDAEIKAIEILQKKVASGYRDVTSFIKSKIINDERVKIVMLVGKTGIIDSDIKHQLREAIAEYDIHFEKINLSSEADIISAVGKYDIPETDILVIARGGGDNLEIFNKASIAERCLHIAPYFLTAIGHKEDNTLLQKVADKGFITPSELGQYLNDIYNNTKDQLENSKAKLVQAITTQLKANYEKQLENLNDKLKSLEELRRKSAEDMKGAHDERIIALNSQITTLNTNHEKQLAAISQQNKAKDDLVNSYQRQLQSLESRTPSINWTAVIIAIIIGFIIGIAMHK